MPIKFGTDGWRAVISDDFTFENVQRVARAVAGYYNDTQHAPRKIAIGYDTRFLSDKYAELVAKVFSQNGIESILSDRPIPTPTLSLAVKNKKLTAGIMITASHNPAAYNGIKIKNATGGAAGVEVTKEVEKRLSDQAAPATGETKPIIKEDLTRDYVKFLRSYIDLKRIKKAKFKVLVDPMHGSGNGFIKEVLKGSLIKLDYVREDINPSFEGLRPEPVIDNLKKTQEKLRKEKYDLCIVLDGDADRIASFAGKGEFIHPQKILGLLMLHLAQDRKMSGGVVKTIAGTNLIDNIAKKLGMKVYETPVGFKYISELMIKEDVLVGGEEAGGMGVKDYIPERDGSMAGLLLLEMMVYRKKPMLKIVQEMEKEFGKYYYVRDDLKLKSDCPSIEEFKSIKTILNRPVVEVKDYDGIKLICGDSSWVMLRASGTEPLVRVYAEAKSLVQANKMLAVGRDFISKICSIVS